MKALENRVIAVTGGAGGIARGIAEAVLEAGGRVGLIDLDLAKANYAASALNSGDHAMGFAADVTDPVGLERAFAALVKRMGPLDGLGPMPASCGSAPPTRRPLMASTSSSPSM